VHIQALLNTLATCQLRFEGGAISGHLLLTLNYDESFIRLPGMANHADTKLPSRTAALTTSSKEMSDA